MKFNTIIASVIMTSVLSISSIANASPACTTASKDKWITEEAMKAKINDLGFKVKTFKITGSCYEIYGWDKDKHNAEVYFNPTDGSIVDSEIN